jgi:hypothetical protein
VNKKESHLSPKKEEKKITSDPKIKLMVLKFHLKEFLFAYEKIFCLYQEKIAACTRKESV